jgi:hypothetical protein
MTLAEVFLLLLIVGWYGSRLESEEAGGEPPTPAEVLQSQLIKKERELQDERRERANLEKRLRDLEEVLKWLGQQLAFPGQIRDIPSADAALRGYTTELKRGKPTCESANVLVGITADDDVLTVIVRERFHIGVAAFEAGQTLSDEQDIRKFLEAVGRYYSERRAAHRDCAFDYTLAWRTDRDFRVAKKRFEPYFYPAGDQQLK